MVTPIGIPSNVDPAAATGAAAKVQTAGTAQTTPQAVPAVEHPSNTILLHVDVPARGSSLTTLDLTGHGEAALAKPTGLVQALSQAKEQYALASRNAAEADARAQKAATAVNTAADDLKATLDGTAKPPVDTTGTTPPPTRADLLSDKLNAFTGNLTNYRNELEAQSHAAAFRTISEQKLRALKACDGTSNAITAIHDRYSFDALTAEQNRARAASADKLKPYESMFPGLKPIVTSMEKSLQ